MEMEHINDNLIKVMINARDLEERGINFLDLIGDQTSIEKFFYSILEEVDVDQHFQESEAVTFQVMPNKDGLELYISKNNFDELGSVVENELTKKIEDFKKAQSLNRERLDSRKKLKQEKNQAKEMHGQELGREDRTNSLDAMIFDVIKFRHLDYVMEAAKVIKKTDVRQSLYYFVDDYYLIFMEDIFLDPIYPTDELWPVMEYGEMTLMGSAYIQEQGHLVIDQNAIETLSQLV